MEPVVLSDDSPDSQQIIADISSDNNYTIVDYVSPRKNVLLPEKETHVKKNVPLPQKENHNVDKSSDMNQKDRDVARSGLVNEELSSLNNDGEVQIRKRTSRKNSLHLKNGYQNFSPTCGIAGSSAETMQGR